MRVKNIKIAILIALASVLISGKAQAYCVPHLSNCYCTYATPCPVQDQLVKTQFEQVSDAIEELNDIIGNGSSFTSVDLSSLGNLSSLSSATDIEGLGSVEGLGSLGDVSSLGEMGELSSVGGFTDIKSLDGLPSLDSYTDGIGEFSGGLGSVNGLGDLANGLPDSFDPSSLSDLSSLKGSLSNYVDGSSLSSLSPDAFSDISSGINFSALNSSTLSDLSSKVDLSSVDPEILKKAGVENIPSLPSDLSLKSLPKGMGGDVLGAIDYSQLSGETVANLSSVAGDRITDPAVFDSLSPVVKGQLLSSVKLSDLNPATIDAAGIKKTTTNIDFSKLNKREAAELLSNVNASSLSKETLRNIASSTDVSSLPASSNSTISKIPLYKMEPPLAASLSYFAGKTGSLGALIDGSSLSSVERAALGTIGNAIIPDKIDSETARDVLSNTDTSQLSETTLEEISTITGLQAPTTGGVFVDPEKIEQVPSSVLSEVGFKGTPSHLTNAEKINLAKTLTDAKLSPDSVKALNHSVGSLSRFDASKIPSNINLSGLSPKAMSEIVRSTDFSSVSPVSADNLAFAAPLKNFDSSTLSSIGNSLQSAKTGGVAGIASVGTDFMPNINNLTALAQNHGGNLPLGSLGSFDGSGLSNISDLGINLGNVGGVDGRLQNLSSQYGGVATLAEQASDIGGISGRFSEIGNLENLSSFGEIGDLSSGLAEGRSGLSDIGFGGFGGFGESLSPDAFEMSNGGITDFAGGQDSPTYTQLLAAVRDGWRDRMGNAITISGSISAGTNELEKQKDLVRRFGNMNDLSENPEYFEARKAIDASFALDRVLQEEEQIARDLAISTSLKDEAISLYARALTARESLGKHAARMQRLEARIDAARSVAEEFVVNSEVKASLSRMESDTLEMIGALLQYRSFVSLTRNGTIFDSPDGGVILPERDFAVEQAVKTDQDVSSAMSTLKRSAAMASAAHNELTSVRQLEASLPSILGEISKHEEIKKHHYDLLSALHEPLSILYRDPDHALSVFQKKIRNNSKYESAGKWSAGISLATHMDKELNAQQLATDFGIRRPNPNYPQCLQQPVIGVAQGAINPASAAAQLNAAADCRPYMTLLDYPDTLAAAEKNMNFGASKSDPYLIQRRIKIHDEATLPEQSQFFEWIQIHAETGRRLKFREKMRRGNTAVKSPFRIELANTDPGCFEGPMTFSSSNLYNYPEFFDVGTTCNHMVWRQGKNTGFLVSPSEMKGSDSVLWAAKKAIREYNEKYNGRDEINDYVKQASSAYSVIQSNIKNVSNPGAIGQKIEQDMAIIRAIHNDNTNQKYIFVNH